MFAAMPTGAPFAATTGAQDGQETTRTVDTSFPPNVALTATEAPRDGPVGALGTNQRRTSAKPMGYKPGSRHSPHVQRT